MDGRKEEEILFLNKKNKIKKTSVIIKIIIAFLFLIAILWIREREICLKIVASGSMEPTLRVGSLCIIEKKYPIQKVKKGDIIAFSLDEDTWVTHRVVQISKDGNFLTKGDANETVDPQWVSKEQYKGKTIRSIWYIGILCIFLYEQKKKLFFVMAGIFLWQQIGRRNNIANKEKNKMASCGRSLHFDRRRGK